MGPTPVVGEESAPLSYLLLGQRAAGEAVIPTTRKVKYKLLLSVDLESD